MEPLPCYVLLPDGTLTPCRDPYQALSLARLWVAIETGRPAVTAVES